MTIPKHKLSSGIHEMIFFLFSSIIFYRYEIDIPKAISHCYKTPIPKAIFYYYGTPIMKDKSYSLLL